MLCIKRLNLAPLSSLSHNEEADSMSVAIGLCESEQRSPKTFRVLTVMRNWFDAGTDVAFFVFVRSE